MDSITSVKIKLLDDRAKLPEKKSDGAAAFDIYALENTELVPFEVTKVRTGISVEIPQGFKGEVYTRSGYGSKGIFIVNQPGKIDCDYRGEVFALLMYVPLNFAWQFHDLRNSLLNFAKDGASAGACMNLSASLQDIKLNCYKIQAGDRIAQFEIQTVEPTQLILSSELTGTTRGVGGMGSTGV